MLNDEATLSQRNEYDSREVTRELVERYLVSTKSNLSLSDFEKERFIAISIAYQLDPFKREIHICEGSEDGKKQVHFIVGYEVYIKKAERTGLLDGWKAWIEGNGDGLKAIVEIQRKDWKNPFVHEVYWAEAVQRRKDGSVLDFWERMPRFQLKKVAISQGFRLCFSENIGGIPYDFSEIPITTERQNDVPPAPTKGASSSGTEVPNLLETIQALTMKNKDILSTTHLEWIETQLRQEKTEAQLRGLLKHVQEAIDAGGDRNEDSKRRNTRTSYPRNGAKSTKPRLPVNYARPPIPQGAPIF